MPGRLAVDGEKPLLPAAGRELPTCSGGTLALPVDPVRARTALEALLPSATLASREPPPEWAADWDGLDERDEYRPDWLEARLLVRELMPTAREVTQERMVEAEQKCGLLGLDGGEGEFAALWATRVAAWLAGDVFDALSREPEPARLAPWSMDLAGQYVRCGMAVEEARAFLRRTGGRGSVQPAGAPPAPRLTDWHGPGAGHSGFCPQPGISKVPTHQHPKD
ncbi:hypothetical protein N4G70_35700 [Streptomyces sp. ASQP_92]|uniref:hypothetical protein n=1 Tax=Streptomyces sp. ASQP_92 TaxID=2979116 RepID=UPI0021BED794|nr:hypothetical protein [Streptomyces sp. ASQP_92]MCT9094151.1 hypothetical protein [Streptomyces sp. ASQP_92]